MVRRKTRTPLTKARQAQGPGVHEGTPLHYSEPVEARYKRELTGMVRQMRDETLKGFRRLDRQFASDAIGMDAPSYASQARILVDALRKRFVAAFARRARPVAERWQSQVDAASSASLHGSLREMSGGISLSTRSIPKAATDMLKASIAENVALIRSIPEQYFLDVQGAVMRNIQRGDGAAGVLREIERVGGVATRRAELIARDQTSKATSALNAARMKGLGIRKFRWLHSSGGKEPRPLHVVMSGNIYSLDDPPVIDDRTGERGLPGQLINCFPGSTQVSLANGCRNLWRYWHSGEVSVIRVEGHGVVECTPNHPILTGRGWLAAHEIQEGDYLVAREPEDVDAVDDEKAKRVTFADLFVAAARAQGSVSAAGAMFDFHGDVPPEDVDCVSTEQMLAFAAGQEGRKLGLPAPDGSSDDVGLSVGREVVHALRPGAGAQSDPLVAGQSAHADTTGARAVPQHHAALGEDVGDDVSGAPVGLGESEHALAGRVAFLDDVALGASDFGRRAVQTVDASLGECVSQTVSTAPQSAGELDIGLPFAHRLLRVVEKGSRIFAGHVYTMETNVGWYHVAPAMIVSKNCRCVAQPVLEFDE